MDNSLDRLHDVFFYSLYMDEEILKAKNIPIRNQRSAYVNNYALRIGNLATLMRTENSRAYGMVYSLTQDEVYSLYEEIGLNEYVTESLLCTLSDGGKIAVLCKNLSQVPKEDESNDEYFAKLKSCMARYGLEKDFTV